MIDLTKFTEERVVAVPIVNNSFQFMRKIYSVQEPVSDGWYNVSIKGNSATAGLPLFIESDPDFMEFARKNKLLIKGYTYNNNIIFQNFDVAKRKSGIDVMAPLYLNNAPSFSAIEAVFWEDKKLYYFRMNYSDAVVYQANMAFLGSTDISQIKGVTPEVKTLYLFHSIESQRIKEEQEKVKRAKELEEFKNTIQGRLLLAFGRAGATILRYSVSGRRITVDWQLEGYVHKYNSVIEADTFRVIEAGYCMSGDDKKHSVSSMVVLAKDYEEDGLIHITRS